MADIKLSADEARRWRVRSQGLDVGVNARESAEAVLDVVRGTGGIQGQDLNAAALQVRVRTVSMRAQAAGSLDTKVGDVWKSLSETRNIVRTWVMRGTLHLIPSEDHRWMTSLFGHSSFSAGKKRREGLGLHEKVLQRALECSVTFFTKYGPLTRQKLGEMLAAEGIPVEGQALNHIVRAGGFLGVITHGPLSDDGRGETFVAADSWLAGIERPELSREEALARLASRYIRAFGPSTERDFAVWSGLPLRDARAGWQAISGELVEVEVAGEKMAAHEEVRPHPSPLPEGEGTIRLLGFFDTYLLGYRGRGLAVGAEHLSRVNAGGGMIRPVVTIDGLAVATWSWTRLSGGRGLEIAVEPFAGMEGALAPSWAREAMAGEVGDIGRFLGVEASLKEG